MAPQIVTRAQWGARAPRGSIATTTWGQRVGVASHHSAGPTTQTVRSIQDHQMDNNGWSDIGYNWLVTQDGRIWEGRAGGWLAIGAHAANQNTGWIGVCWIGTSGATAPSAAALASLRWLVDEARRLAGRRLDVRGHGQVPGQATECPGSRLRAWINDGMPVQQPAEQEDDMFSDKDREMLAEVHRQLEGGITSVDGSTWRIRTAIQRTWHRLHGDVHANLRAVLAAQSGEDAVQTIGQMIAEAAEQARAERAELAELVAQVASGERDAAGVVDEIGRRLAGVPDGGND